MNKEDVIKIKSTRILDTKYFAVLISYQNEEILKRNEFSDEIGVASINCPAYDSFTKTLYIRGKKELKDDNILIVEEEDYEIIKDKINKINEKYGVKKDWVPDSNNDYYYFIDMDCYDCFDWTVETEKYKFVDDSDFKIHNIFKCKEYAEEALKEVQESIVNIFRKYRNMED